MALVVFTSGIVDDAPGRSTALLSTTQQLLELLGVEPGVTRDQKELTHCWALRNQAGSSPRELPPGDSRPLCLTSVRRRRALVGTDLVNWIVDASIFAVGHHAGRDYQVPLEYERCLVFVVVVFVECL
jgi:hypothetical protein